MRNATALFLLAAVGAVSTFGQQPTGVKAPKLVLLIAADQFRADYLTRFRSEYKHGFKRLLERGAVFGDANLEHYPTVTAIGHSTMLSGATPAMSGIMGNDWFDRPSGKTVTSVSDPGSQLLGASGEASSPHRLLVSTLGDEMKRARPGTKVIGASLKDRSAILPVGRMADAAYWLDVRSGAFVTSSWYQKSLPAAVEKWNSEKHAEAYGGKTWFPGRQIPSIPGSGMYGAIYSSAFGNELLEAFAERLIDSEKLGQRGEIDLLSVSFSSNDAIGHELGPDAPEVRAISIATDEVLGKLLDRVDTLIGLDQTIVIFTADHGVAPSPETLSAQHMPGGRLLNPEFFGTMVQALNEAFGPGDWLLSTAGSSPYFNYKTIRDKKVDPADVQRVASRALLGQERVARVYTREQLLAGRVAGDRFDARVIRSFHAQRSGDLEVLLDPYWIRGKTTATHGTPWLYDSHIPLILMGPHVKPGLYLQPAALNDVAPTLAALVQVETPSGSVGRVLTEALTGLVP